MKITYSFADGEKAIIEVDEQWGEILVELDRQEYNNNQNETKKHASLDAMDYEGEFFADQDSFFEHFFDAPDDVDILYEAMETLLPSQKELLQALFFDGMRQEEYARKKGITQSAVAHQLQRILKKLKKFFK